MANAADPTVGRALDSGFVNALPKNVAIFAGQVSPFTKYLMKP